MPDAQYQRLDGRLETSAFDPSVPYFLDEEGSVQTITGRKSAEAARPAEPVPERPRPWRKFWN